MSRQEPAFGRVEAYAKPRFDVRTIELQGLTFLDIDERRFVDLVISEAHAGRGGWVVTPNTDIMRLAYQDPAIHALLRSADALVADGTPLIWASRLQQTPLRGGRVCGSDLIVSVPAAAARTGLSVFLLGGGGDTSQHTAAALIDRNPTLRVAGTYAPPFGFEQRPEEIAEIRRRVAESKAEIVFVALSFPKGERLIQQIRDALPHAWWIGVGAAFDFVSGQIRRAPAWMQDSGTEWLFRMVQDPKRLVRRYFWHDLPYAAVLLTGSLRRGLPFR
jgi:N-acetylglucosaminyldiphosphoundecaprenol N-acetyl-beta-D-mannosaminyltransferase